MPSRIAGKCVAITGASAGIGEAAAREFAAEGCNLILLARRKEKVESLAQELAKAHNITAKGLGVDVSDEAAVKAALGNEVVDVMIANAGGVVGMDHIATVPTSAIDSMIDTNIKGLIYSVQTVVPGMKERGSGHIITISSISGKEVYPGGGVYSGTKHMVNAITRTLRQELLGSGIRVSEMLPGAVESEFALVRFGGDEEKARAVYKGMDPLVGKDIAEALVFMANRPPHVNMADVMVLPSQQATDGPVMFSRRS